MGGGFLQLKIEQNNLGKLVGYVMSRAGIYLGKVVVCVEVTVARVPEFHELVMARTAAISAVAHGIRSLGSAALIICYVATGSLGAFQMDEIQAWDVAGGVVILREAGGIAYNTYGGPFDPMNKKYLFAGNKALADQLVAVIKEADKAFLKDA